MNKQSMIIAILVAIIVVGGGYIFVSQDTKSSVSGESGWQLENKEDISKEGFKEEVDQRELPGISKPSEVVKTSKAETPSSPIVSSTPSLQTVDILGAQVTYPSGWGGMVQNSQPGPCGESNCGFWTTVNIEGMPSAGFFLSSFSDDYKTLGRGWFWGDLANQYGYIGDFVGACENSNTISCTVVKNDNQITFARYDLDHSADPNGPGSEGKKFSVYVTSVPQLDGGYEYIALSSVRMNIEPGMNELFEKYVVGQFSF